MTAVLTNDTAPVVLVQRPRRAALTGAAEHVGALMVLLWWALPMTRATGGREPHALSVGLVIVVAAIVAGRPWRHLRPAEMAAVAALPAAALVVCLASPVGWRGANELGSWAFAAGAYVVARAYLRSPGRVRGALLAVSLTGLAEFAASWLAWWGGENPAVPMIGTFYWHNQFAAFLLAPALVALALAVWPRSPGVAAGWVAAPLCSVGVLFSTSRATLGLLVLGWLAIAGVACSRPDRRKAVARLLAAAALTVATAYALTGPPFFPHRAAPNAAVAQRSQEESAGGNAAWRTKEWREAGQVYAAYPVTGTGFHGYLAGTSKMAPRQVHSAFAHDAWLQAFADGGTVLGLPFLLASLWAAGAVIRRVVRGLRARDNPVGVAAGVAALALAAHSLVDFDTSYPALFAMLAIAVALALAPSSAELEAPVDAGRPAPGRRSRSAGLAAALVLCGVASVAVAPAWHGGLHLNLPLQAPARSVAGR